MIRRVSKSGTSALQAVLENERPALDVGNGCVREVHIAHAPVAWTIGVIGSKRAAEERELTAEAATAGIAEVAGEVPPLDLEPIVPAVIAREGPRAGVQGLLKDGRRGRRGANQEQ